jgi:hypothetical protein
MTDIENQRRIFVFTTPAGSGFGTHAGGSHLPLPKFMQHWGIMIGKSQHDPNALMIELDKGMKTWNLPAKIWPLIWPRAQREREEALLGNRLPTIIDTGFSTLYTSTQIAEIGKCVCFYCLHC